MEIRWASGSDFERHVYLKRLFGLFAASKRGGHRKKKGNRLQH